MEFRKALSTKERVDRLFGKKDEEEDWRLNSYILCKKFGWDYYTLLKQPIPFVIDMMAMIVFEAEKNAEPTPQGGKKTNMPFRKPKRS